MKWKHKDSGLIFVTDNENLFSMLRREGYEPVEEKKKKKK